MGEIKAKYNVKSLALLSEEQAKEAKLYFAILQIANL